MNLKNQLPVDPFEYGPGEVTDNSGYENSFYTAEFTFVHNSLSCHRNVFPMHLAFSYIMVAAGALSLLTRLVPGKYKWLHLLFGRIYVMGMFWSTVTSVWIHNFGFPLAIIYTFIILMLSMTIGYFVILVHQLTLQPNALLRVTRDLLAASNAGQKFSGDLAEMIGAAKDEISKEKTYLQRIFSWKGLHGFLMAWSYLSVVFRAFSSTNRGANQNLTFVPTMDPNWENTTFSFGADKWVGNNVARSMYLLIPCSLLCTTFFWFMDHKNSKNTENSQKSEESKVVGRLSHDDVEGGTI